MRENKAGFSEMLLVLVIAVLIGAVSFIVYQSKIATQDVSPSQPVLKEPLAYTLTDLEDGRVILNNTTSGYSIAFPKDWSTQVSPNGGLTEIYNPRLYSGGDNRPHGSVIIEEFYAIPTSDETQLTSTEVINEIELDCKENLPSNLSLDCWIKTPRQDKYLNIKQIVDEDSGVNRAVEDILFTFKFNK